MLLQRWRFWPSVLGFQGQGTNRERRCHMIDGVTEPISGMQREELEETEGHRSRVMGDYQARFCGGLRVKFPRPTRSNEAFSLDPIYMLG